MSKIVILLTATIDPGRCIGVKQNQIKERVESYRRSFRQWQKLQLPHPIYIIESSGYGNPFSDLALDTPQSNIHYISVKLPMKHRWGKGYGEALIQRYFLREIVTEPDTVVIKFTGRWAPVSKRDGSFAELLQKVERLTDMSGEDSVSGIVKLQIRESTVDVESEEGLVMLRQLTRWFVLRHTPFLEFIEKCLTQNRFNDLKGVKGWYECVFYQWFSEHLMLDLDGKDIEVVENCDGSYNTIATFI